MTLATDRPASTSSRDESPNFHHEKAQRTPAVSTTPDDFVGKEPEADFSEAAKQNLLMGTRRSDRSDDQTDQCTSPVLSSRRSLASLSESSLPLGHLRRQASERRTNTQGSLFRVDDASMESAGAPAVHSSSSSSSPSRPSGPSFFYAVLPNLNNHPCQVQSSGVDSTPSSAPPERHRVLKPVSAALRMFPPAPSPRVTMMGNKHPGARHHTASGKGSSDDRHWRVTLEETPFQQKSDAQNTSSVGTRGIRSSLGSSYFTRLWGDVKPAGEGCGVSQCSTTSESGAGPDGKQQMQPGNRSMKITCRAKCLKGECSSSDEALNKLLERHRGMLEAAKEESRRALRDLLARSERCPTFPTRRITFEDSENSDTEFLTREQNGFYPGSASTAPRGPGMASTRLPAAKASSRHMGHVNSSLSSQEMQVFLRERKGLAQMGFDHNAEDNLLTAAAVLRHPAGRAHIEPGGRLQTLPRRKRQQQSDARAGRASAYGSSRLARADLPRSSAFSALPSPTALMSAAQGHALATDLRSSW